MRECMVRGMEASHQDYVFVTESSLQKELDQLEAETVGNQHIEQPVANIHVTEMNKKKLSIKVQKANRKGKKEHKDVNLDVHESSQTEEEEEDIVEDDLPSSAGIEIFHEKNIPNLHGILKQRSVSESSDDLSSSQGSCSPMSPRDDMSKKSVHFNDRIDKTTFKSGMAVTSMTKALKSKRRRNRKRDEKKSGRLRQNSGGSEGSTSGEELDLCRTSVTEEEEGEFCDQVIEGIQQEAASNEEKEVISEVKENNKIDDCVKGTSAPTENEVEMKVKAIKDKISEERTNSSKADSDDDDDYDECDKIKGGDLIVKSGDGDFRTTKNKSANEKSMKVDKSVKVSAEAAKGTCSEKENEKDSELNVERVREPVEGTKVVAAGDVLNTQNILDLQDKDTTVLKIVQDDKQNGNDSGVECGLDGGDTHGEVQANKTQGDGGSEDLNSLDHRTQCAFQFSNALMFDLDVD